MTLKKIIEENPEVQVILVSKGQSPENITSSLPDKKKHWNLGENYFEELKKKFCDPSLVKLNISWHFLGALQSRKIEELCQMVVCFHSLSREKELKIISKQNKKPSFYIQVNISGENQKNGCAPEQLPDLIKSLRSFSLEANFLGLMAVASNDSSELVSGQFALLRSLRDEHCPKLKLNMGMTADYLLAIKEGSNVLRLGSLVFGKRLKRN